MSEIIRKFFAKAEIDFSALCSKSHREMAMFQRLFRRTLMEKRRVQIGYKLCTVPGYEDVFEDESEKEDEDE